MRPFLQRMATGLALLLLTWPHPLQQLLPRLLCIMHLRLQAPHGRLRLSQLLHLVALPPLQFLHLQHRKARASMVLP